MSLDAAAVIGSLQQTQFLDIDTTYFDYLICLNTHIKQLFYGVLTTDYLKESTATFLYHGNFPYKIEICEKKKKQHYVVILLQMSIDIAGLFFLRHS